MADTCEFDLLGILHACADTSESMSSNNRYLRLSPGVKSVVYLSLSRQLCREVFLSLFAESRHYLKIRMKLGEEKKINKKKKKNK